MQKCRICNGTDFYKEAGYFFCQTCQTQNEDIREEVLELRIDTSTRLRKTRIRRLRSDKSGDELGWTSWELYNFVLIGLTNELVELGVSSDIKLTVLQLWATYLGKLEVAFISTKKKSVPKLARRYNKKDAEIIYGKVQSQRRSRKRRKIGSSTNTSMISAYQSGGSSMRELSKNKRLLATADYDRFLQSQGSSEGDGLSLFSQSAYSNQSSSIKSSNNEGKVQFSSHAKEEARKIKRLSRNIPRYKRASYRINHISTQYRIGPNIITPMKLWAIVYIALRIHDQPIQLGDMLRYGREGHLSYYKLDHLIPPEVNLTKRERNFLSQNVEITHKGMRRIIASIAKLLGVWDIVCPDFLPLISRYCQELGLPKGIKLYTERLIALSPPKMIFNGKKSYIPNYEGRAIAFIIVVLKTLLALDDITEYQVSRIAEKINSVAIKQGLLTEKLFSFQEWQKYIECRKTILTHSHFPTKMKYGPDTHGIDDLYFKFLESITSKADKKETDIKNSKHFLPEPLVNAMTTYISNLNVNDFPPKAIDVFPPSLTPLHSYLQHLLDHPLYDIPSVVRNDFFLTKVGYMTKPDSLIELAMECDINLEIIDSSLHFLEKVVPPFEQPRMPSIEELKQLVDVQDDSNTQHTEGSENLNDYLHRKIPCRIKFNVAKEQYYDKVRSSAKNFRNIDLGSDFGFSETLPNGRLAIPNDSDSDSEDEKEDINLTNRESILLGKKLCEKYNLHLSVAEKESINESDISKRMRFKKHKLQFARNAKGQFIKGSAVSINVEENNEDSLSETDLAFQTSTQINLTEKMHNDIDKIMEEELPLCEGIDINNITIDDIDTAFPNLNDYFNLSEISLFRNSDDNSMLETNLEKDIANNKYQFFRPFKHYWMYHCIFSRVKPKNFAVFERSLPRNFRWLLNECALAVEMSTEDLYEEVCLIETYHANILKSTSEDINRSSTDPMSKNQINLILSRW
ncbi:TATA box-binding protein-associated factor RNA polymerase I subunit B isoform X1 [Hylaeus anthracinus]|uniref:TATA box-binding protein-associated factor RNA polymerase I subunit B isoform X1 n=1 Tax=Hylaeus anthracinus TaxID=313031 RepID=UPI0023B9314B|nr:TATA box-binding protein-associated factor RNA polymerase I subunit B isoform X1 [Hylaeus anthracinus]